MPSKNSVASQSHNTKQKEHASQENGKKGMQIFQTRMCNVTRDCTLIDYNDTRSRGLRGNSQGIAASSISLLSMVALEKSVGGA